jgi:hypothetical protein
MKNETRKHKAVGKEFLFPSPETTVRVSWNDQNGFWWNETCAIVLEVFGLPGDRFTSHPTPDFMNFHFKSKKDAELCKILLSERI